MNKQKHGYEWAREVNWSGVPGCVLEIGSERGGGSTAYLAEISKAMGREFISVDYEQGAHDRATLVKHCLAVQALGCDFLGAFEQPVAFAYLDNFDWLYQALPKTSAERQRRMYKEHGMALTNTNSALEHLKQAEIVMKMVPPGGIIAFDDCWISAEHGVWLGKGMFAVPQLMDLGWVLLNEPEVASEITSGYAVLRKVH